MSERSGDPVQIPTVSLGLLGRKECLKLGNVSYTIFIFYKLLTTNC